MKVGEGDGEKKGGKGGERESLKDLTQSRSDGIYRRIIL